METGICKMVGMFMILGGMGGLGMSIVEEWRRELKLRENIVFMIERIKHSLVYEKSTVLDMAEEYAGRKELPFSGCFKELAEQIRKRQKDSLLQMWKNSFVNGEIRKYLNEEDICKFWQIAKCLEEADAKRSSECLEGLCVYFKETIYEKKKIRCGKEKTVLGICMAAGALLCIVIW